jgi:mRNA interferase HicA
MKRNQLIKHLKKYGAFLLREGSRHTIFQKGQLKTQIPRHNEIVDELARKICKDLNIPFTR